MNNKLLKISLITISFLQLIAVNVRAQNEIYIFKDDTLEINKYTDKIQDSLKQHYFSIPYFDFKENLPDGTYYFIDLKRKEISKKKRIEDYIIMQGSYSNGKRHGKFDYYSFGYEGRKKVRVHTRTSNYAGGLLHGYYKSYGVGNGAVAIPMHEAYYKHGKKHGFFITYDFHGEGGILRIELFDNDELKYVVNYSDKNEMLELDTNPTQPVRHELPNGMPLRIGSKPEKL